MGPAIRGVMWCLVLVALEAIQAVYFGGLFQRMDAFLIGGLIFVLTVVGSVLWTAATSPNQLRIARRNMEVLVGANVTAAIAWVAYLVAIQLIEPAIAMTLFTGAIPLTTLAAFRLGVKEANDVRGRLEAYGNLLLLVSLLFLAAVTIAGWSGFVRGGTAIAVAGIVLATLSGVGITWTLFFCTRLDRAGVGPVAQFGLRFVIFVFVAFGGAALGLDYKGAVPVADILVAVLVGLVVMAFPLYAVQRAIALVPPLTIGAIGALGPLVIFVLQIFEGRVTYAPATLAGLAIFFLGSLLAALGATAASAVQAKEGCAA